MYVAPESNVLFGLASVAATSQEPATTKDAENFPDDPIED